MSYQRQPLCSSTAHNVQMSNSSNPRAIMGTSTPRQTQLSEETLKKIDHIKTVISSIVAASKPPCSLRSVIRDYYEVEGEPVPYRQLGFQTPEELLRFTRRFHLDHIHGEIFISLLGFDKSMAHVQKLVAEQKPSRTKSRNRKPKPMINRYSRLQPRNLSYGGSIKQSTPRSMPYNTRPLSQSCGKQVQPVRNVTIMDTNNNAKKREIDLENKRRADEQFRKHQEQQRKLDMELKKQMEQQKAAKAIPKTTTTNTTMNKLPPPPQQQQQTKVVQKVEPNPIPKSPQTESKLQQRLKIMDPQPTQNPKLETERELQQRLIEEMEKAKALEAELQKQKELVEDLKSRQTAILVSEKKLLAKEMEINQEQENLVQQSQLMLKEWEQMKIRTRELVRKEIEQEEARLKKEYEDFEKDKKELERQKKELQYQQKQYEMVKQIKQIQEPPQQQQQKQHLNINNNMESYTNEYSENSSVYDDDFNDDDDGDGYFDSYESREHLLSIYSLKNDEISDSFKRELAETMRALQKRNELLSASQLRTQYTNEELDITLTPPTSAESTSSINPLTTQLLQRQEKQNSKQFQKRVVKSVQGRLKVHVNDSDFDEDGLKPIIDMSNNLSLNDTTNSYNVDIKPVAKPLKPSVQNRLKVHLINGNNSTNGYQRVVEPISSTPISKWVETPQHLDNSFEKEGEPSKYDIIELKAYCITKNLGLPKFTYFENFDKPELTMARVHVGNFCFSTYPDSYPNKELAMYSCARRAVTEMKKRDVLRPQKPCTYGDRELIEVLYRALLEEHPRGIFAQSLPDMFEERFKQKLCNHWWSLVQNSKKFKTEMSMDKLIIFANEDLINEPENENVSTVVNQLKNIDLPWQQEHWPVVVTCCTSTTNIWAHLSFKENIADFEKLLKNVDTAVKVPASPIEISQVYILAADEWYFRVRIEELDDDNKTALCFFVDFGDYEWHPIDKLYMCEGDALAHPAQAINFSLIGLEDYEGHPLAKEVLDDLLLQKSFYVHVANEANGAEGKLPAVFFKAIEDQGTYEILHTIFRDEVKSKIVPPKLGEALTNVNVTHITSDGCAYVQVLGKDLEYLQNLLQKVSDCTVKNLRPEQLSRGNLYLVCEEHNGVKQVYRGLLSNVISYNKDNTNDSNSLSDGETIYEMLLIDNGIVGQYTLSNIFSLDICEVLKQYPAQAIFTTLANIPAITLRIVGRLRALLPPNTTACVRVVENGTVPSVKIYTKHGENVLCTVNDEIRMEYEFETSACNEEYIFEPDPSASSEEVTEPLKVLPDNSKRTDNGNSAPINYTVVDPTVAPFLKEHVLLHPGAYFEGRIVACLSPIDLSVQLCSDYGLLRTIVTTLQEFCKQKSSAITTLDKVFIGQAYVALHPDGYFHRVIVEEIIENSDMVRVRFCDFGDCLVINWFDLKHLPLEYRKAPQLAMRATLEGLDRLFWYKEHIVYLRELILGKVFFCYVEKHIKSETGTKLELKIYTSNDNNADITITELFRAEMAKKEEHYKMAEQKMKENGTGAGSSLLDWQM